MLILFWDPIIAQICLVLASYNSAAGIFPTLCSFPFRVRIPFVFIMDMLISLLVMVFNLPVEEILSALFLSAGLLILLSPYRWSLLVLATQYLLLTSLLYRLTPPLALTKGLGGFAVCILILLSKRQPPIPVTPRVAIARWLVRLLVALFALLGAYGLWQSHPLPMLSPVIQPAVYLLILSGLLLVASSRDALPAALGLLSLANGLEVAYTSLHSSLLVGGALNAMHILLGLAVAHLVSVEAVAQSELESQP
ncbi:MAG: hypothetical protein H5T64_00080 [Chloroflexi bacterium]|nr:hypothetical protein [Chloroflexota bacterium]